MRTRSAARLIFVGVMVLLGYGLLFVKASVLMLLPDKRIEDQASGQFEASVKVQGRRGDLLDRDGVILASTVDLAELHVDPSVLSDAGKHRMATAMASALDLDATALERRLRVPGRQDVRLVKGLTPQQLSSLRESVAADEGLEAALFSRRDRKRVYPGAADAAALLGVVGRSGVGLAGLERVLEGQLR
ncbi:MAG: hypothetical protein GXP62_10890, partial [Oligoflexia bacterium]|nr:hypothetical protein [Oligoflexia bacterium]